MAYDSNEQVLIRETFSKMLATATGDGGAKRLRGEKPPWWRDPSHEAAMWSHVNKWKHGEKSDKDSGAHPLVHLAWRALAIAYQETYGEVPPADDAAINPESGRTYHDDCRPPLRDERLSDPGASDPCGRPDCEYAKLDIGHGHTTLHWWDRQKAAHFASAFSTGTASSAVHGPSTPGHPDYLGGSDELDRVRGRK